MSEIETTLVIAKPDAVQRGLVTEILASLERKGLRFVGLKVMRLDRELAEQHYAVHRGKPFYQGLVEFITSGPVVIAAVQGPSAIEAVRNLMGSTNPVTAAPGSIRGRFALEIGKNLVHGSDSPETADYELNLFFRQNELVQFERSVDEWIAEAQ